MNANEIKAIILNHKERFLNRKGLIKREVLSNIDKIVKTKEIIFISGIRRCGKSSLMRLIYDELVEKFKVTKNNVLFVNFEDERFVNFLVDDFERLYQSFLELENPIGKKYLFFDEIQNIENWERWLNRLYEFEDVKIFITGSNASLFSSSVSNSLTGRNRQINLNTFSFKEYLFSEGKNYTEQDLLLSKEIVQIKRSFTNYINYGGFPEVLFNKDLTIADQYFKDIIYRDVISKNNLRNIKEIRELCLFIISNTGSLSSYESLRKTINAKNVTTIKNYIKILEDVFLISSLSLYDYSIKKQIYNPDKYYITDIGFYRVLGFTFSDNSGKVLENIVFEHLQRKNKEIYYWKSNKGLEVDFLIKDKTKISEAYQVTFNLSNENREREIRSLAAVYNELGSVKCFILTSDQEETIKFDSMEIEVIPVWKWMIAQGST